MIHSVTHYTDFAKEFFTMPQFNGTRVTVISFTSLKYKGSCLDFHFKKILRVVRVDHLYQIGKNVEKYRYK
jgi:hypothetical protein